MIDLSHWKIIWNQYIKNALTIQKSQLEMNWKVREKKYHHWKKHHQGPEKKMRGVKGIQSQKTALKNENPE